MKALIILLLLTSCAKPSWDNGLGAPVVCDGKSSLGGMRC